MNAHTEADAGTKWCPFAHESRTSPPVPWNATGSAQERPALNCIGSACMAWRWVYGNPAESESKGGILLPKESWPGYCGMMQPVTANEA